ncbi:MAG: CinA family protein [Limnobacter sp.]|nr:CinA family protein [Limnobacter sp.]
MADHFVQHKARLAVVESCTGGALGAVLTTLPGASDWFQGGFITYADDAKMKHVYVRESTLQTEGAVSEECVKEMANGGMIAMGVDCCLSVSGIAGPGGATAEKPVGTVWIGLAVRHHSIEAFAFAFQGDRQSVREQAVSQALNILEQVALKSA